jgi:outer membrane protein assembly factor BamE (lipoprotein component of BamABCDE complex)
MQISNFIKFFFVVSFTSTLLFFVGCVTPQSKALRHVEVGMTKNEVLDMVGDPARTGRNLNQDQWVYVTHGENSDETIYVFFSEGRVTYVGPSEEAKPIVHSVPDGAVEAAPAPSPVPAPAKDNSDFKSIE